MEERIDDYIRGRMTPEEEQKFLADCKSNPELKEQAIMTAYLVKALNQLHDEGEF